MIIDPDIFSTEDGSHTLIHPLLGEHYHSTRGAVGESMHIYIEHGLKTITKESINILECGFGSGLNCYLTLKEQQQTDKKISYTAIELYPISMDTIVRMDYNSDPDFMKLHRSHWGEWVEISHNFSLKKINIKMEEMELDDKYDLVYFDAFAPDSQPELWSYEIFSKIYNSMSNDGVLVTYSAKGSVKQALRSVGFEVHREQGALGKHHMLKAIKR